MPGSTLAPVEERVERELKDAKIVIMGTLFLFMMTFTSIMILESAKFVYNADGVLSRFHGLVQLLVMLAINALSVFVAVIAECHLYGYLDDLE
jgi:hypothetical protein